MNLDPKGRRDTARRRAQLPGRELPASGCLIRRNVALPERGFDANQHSARIAREADVTLRLLAFRNGAQNKSLFLTVFWNAGSNTLNAQRVSRLSRFFESHRELTLETLDRRPM